VHVPLVVAGKFVNVKSDTEQCDYSKRLSGLRQCSYQERLCRLQLHSLELRRLLMDLVCCYKILFGQFGRVHLESEEYFFS